MENKIKKNQDILKIKNLDVKIKDKIILENINLEFKTGTINVILGPNGAGKSTIANILMGNPIYKIKKGQILLNNEDITLKEADFRAKKGIFLSFQNPQEIPGVLYLNFLKDSYNNIKNKNLNLIEMIKIIDEKSKKLNFNFDIKKKDLNANFSGGEKKKSEILQMLILEPKFIILDEIDSGLDIDSLNLIIKILEEFYKTYNVCLIIISHNKKILEKLKPENVYIINFGKIIKKGNNNLIEQVFKSGFSKF